MVYEGQKDGDKKVSWEFTDRMQPRFDDIQAYFSSCLQIMRILKHLDWPALEHLELTLPSSPSGSSAIRIHYA
jgi:hypothetical protein